jgi:hypothetical protein
MYLTALRPQKPGDQQKADAIAAAAKEADCLAMSM